MSLPHEEWYLCWLAYKAAYITAQGLRSVSLLTMAAKSADRLLALRMAEIQTNCNFKAHVLHSSNLLGTDCRGWFMLHFRLPNRYVLWPYNYTILANNISGLVHKYFLRPQSSPWGSFKRFIQQQQIQPNALNMARYKKAVYSELWVQLALVGCYSPIGVSGIAIASNNTYSSHLIVTWGVAIVSVYFN